MSQLSLVSLLVNPLASLAQLEISSSQLDGVPQELERSVHYAASGLIQAAGPLLRLPQDVVASAIVIFTRFWVGPDGGSLREYGAGDIAAASLYLVTKASAYPTSRSILNVFAYLSACPPGQSPTPSSKPDPATYYLSEGSYQDQRSLLYKHETIILRTLGFNTHVALPYTLCINYLQTLDVFTGSTAEGKRLARRAFAHLNTALLSPQLVYLTHHPTALATAAIYLSAKETGVKLPEDEWWEVFDCDREDLGFLVVAMLSMPGWAEEESRKWQGRAVPMTVAEVEQELRRESADGGNVK